MGLDPCIPRAVELGSLGSGASGSSGYFDFPSLKPSQLTEAFFFFPLYLGAHSNRSSDENNGNGEDDTLVVEPDQGNGKDSLAKAARCPAGPATMLGLGPLVPLCRDAC